MFVIAYTGHHKAAFAHVTLVMQAHSHFGPTHDTMFAQALFLASVLVAPFTTNNSVPPLRAGNTCIVVLLGGPPSIRIAGKASGDISHAEWGRTTKVDLAGCMPDARVTSLDICIKDCNAKDYKLVTKSAELTSGMLTMVANLPPGTPFTVTVKVVDGNGKDVPVLAGKYVWKG